MSELGFSPSIAQIGFPGWLVNNINQIYYVGARLYDVFNTIRSASFYLKLSHRKQVKNKSKHGQKNLRHEQRLSKKNESGFISRPVV